MHRFDFLMGFLILVIGLLFLHRGEVQANRDKAVIAAIAAEVVDADTLALNPSLDGRIVHASGLLQSDSALVDPNTGVTVRGLRLHRSVEMYQWARHESFYTSHRPKIWWGTHVPGGPTITDPKAPDNPLMPFESYTFKAQSPHLGSYHLDGALLSRVLVYSPAPVGAAAVLPGSNMLYQGYDPAAPSIGDVRIMYYQVPYQPVSVIALQEGDRLVPIHSVRSGEDIPLIRTGNVSAAAMTGSILRHVAGRRWTSRFFAFVAATAAMVLILRATAREETQRIVPAAAACCAIVVLYAALALYPLLGEPRPAWVVLAGCVAAGLLGVFINKLDARRRSMLGRARSAGRQLVVVPPHKYR